MNKTVRYQIKPINPQAHLFEVVCCVVKPNPEGQVFTLPAWIPGSYMIRDFARNVVSFKAICDAQSIAVEKLDKQTWRCAPCDGELCITMQIYAWDHSVRSAHLDTTHAYFNGTSVFLAAEGMEHFPCIVDIHAPDDISGWQLATSMPLLGAKEWGFGTYQASCYDELIDHPVEMSDFSIGSFSACGTPHHMVLTGRHDTDMPRFCDDLIRICEHHIRFFGEPAPMNRYVFMSMVTGSGYGGLEHRASTSLMCSRDSLPVKGETRVTENYRQMLGLCSHEYFHTWNIKRIMPEAFIPFKLDREIHTRLLWAFEGITSYYDDLALCRTHLIDVNSYLELLGQTMTRVWRGQGRFKQSVAESSFDAWTRFYKQDENALNSIVSYYTKGALIALCVDLKIRLLSDDKSSLDDVMRLLWQRYGLTGKGVPEYGVEAIIEEVAGANMQDFFSSVLDGYDDPPLELLLAEFGVQFQLRAATSQQDKGGNTVEEGILPAVSLGIRSVKVEAGERVNVVFDNGAAQLSGIAAGDVIIAIDGLQVFDGNLEKRLKIYNPGDEIEIHLFRRDELMIFKVKLLAPPADTCVVTLLENIDEATQIRQNKWLHQ